MCGRGCCYQGVSPRPPIPHWSLWAAWKGKSPSPFIAFALASPDVVTSISPPTFCSLSYCPWPRAWGPRHGPSWPQPSGASPLLLAAKVRVPSHTLMQRSSRQVSIGVPAGRGSPSRGLTNGVSVQMTSAHPRGALWQSPHRPTPSCISTGGGRFSGWGANLVWAQSRPWGSGVTLKMGVRSQRITTSVSSALRALKDAPQSLMGSPVGAHSNDILSLPVLPHNVLGSLPK